jgi:CRP-like cAMP-binding protein
MDIVARLAQHRTVGGAPRHELEWLAARGRIRHIAQGDLVVRKGQRVEDSDYGLEVVVTGRFSIDVDRGGGPRKVMEWQAGDVAGVLPFSRMAASPGDTIAETDVETLSLPPRHFPELIRECPSLTMIFVHVMLDRARVFNTSDWQDERMVSLGKLSAGLAHELNNPASAIHDDAEVLNAVGRDLRARFGDAYRVVKAGSGAEACRQVAERAGGLADAAAPGPDHVRHASRLSSWRSRKRRILPVAVFGNASRNITRRGYL